MSFKHYYGILSNKVMKLYYLRKVLHYTYSLKVIFYMFRGLAFTVAHKKERYKVIKISN